MKWIKKIFKRDKKTIIKITIENVRKEQDECLCELNARSDKMMGGWCPKHHTDFI